MWLTWTLAAPLAVPDVFTELELFTMEMADEVGTVDGNLLLW